MALSLAKQVLLRPRLMKSCLLVVNLASCIQGTSLRSICGTQSVQESDLRTENYQNATIVQQRRVNWECSSHEILSRKLELSLKDQQLDEAWKTFLDFKSLYGFPNYSLVSKLIIELSYSTDPQWLQRTCNLVFLILKDKPGLLNSDLLAKLCLSLARAQMPIPASIILRLMLEKGTLPVRDVLWSVVLHMVKTETGSHLVSNFVFEIYDSFDDLSANKSLCAKLMKPDTMIFNLALDACVRFGSIFKAHQIMELMAQVGVIADAHTIVIISRIHEINGQRNALKKFKDHIDRAPVQLIRHYRQYYDSLLSLHFKFNDIDAATELVLDFYKQKDRKILNRPCLVPIGSHNIRGCLKIQIDPELVDKDTVLEVDRKQELVVFRNGKLVLTNKAIAKLINGHKRCGKIDDLATFLFGIQNELGSSGEGSLSPMVIETCIDLGWLETAHDILDDIKMMGSPMGEVTYKSLFIAYHKRQMFREAKALLKQMRILGFFVNLSDEMIVSKCLSEDKSLTFTRKSDLTMCLIREMREEEQAIPPVLYELNSSIYFFCKAKMIDDALRTYRRMQEMKIQPTTETFANLAAGYSNLGMYREITILWGDIKRHMECGNGVVNRDLYEFLALNFLRGGYFERVMEVISHMREHGMYGDKCMYKKEFLKFHKDLYRNLKASKARNEVQRNRLEYVQAFRKWVGID